MRKLGARALLSMCHYVWKLASQFPRNSRQKELHYRSFPWPRHYAFHRRKRNWFGFREISLAFAIFQNVYLSQNIPSRKIRRVWNSSKFPLYQEKLRNSCRILFKKIFFLSIISDNFAFAQNLSQLSCAFKINYKCVPIFLFIYSMS